jgi:hypothetical protein
MKEILEKIEELFKIDKMKAYQKWLPILDSLGITNKEIGMFGAEYAETLSNKNQLLVPINLTVLSKLNIKYRNYELTEDNINEIEFKFNFTEEEFDFFNTNNLSGMDKVRLMENEIINSIVKKINSELDHYDTIIINQLITSMQITDVNTWVVKCRYKFENRGNMFNVRQQVYDLLKKEFGSKFKYIKVDVTMYEEKPSDGIYMTIDTNSGRFYRLGT